MCHLIPRYTPATMLARLALVLACATVILVEPAPAAVQADALFEFHSNPWLNLHHILWAQGKPAELPADMPEAERSTWQEGITFYAPYAKRNLLFDDDLLAIKEALRTVETKTSLDGVAIDAGVKATLERLMPIYRKHWWPAHDRTNREWIAAARKLVDQYGPALNVAIGRAYGVTPENPVWVDVAVYAHPVGAYTSNPPTHVMISSTDPGYSGYGALEMLFHERSHAWGRMLFDGVTEAANAQGVKIPPQLSHAILFYTAGELTARELKQHGIAYKHYAEGGLYDRLCGTGCGEKLAANWGPYLDGKRTRPEAFTALVASFK
jgi:hypothetical protein